MSTLFTGKNFKALFVAGLLALTVSGASQAAADTTDESRSSISRHYADGGRDNPTITSESKDDFEALVKSGTRSKTATSAGSSKLGSGTESTQSVAYDFWFYDVDVDLFAMTITTGTSMVSTCSSTLTLFIRQQKCMRSFI